MVYARVWPEPTEPTPIERRGKFDDDDYVSIIGLDDDAVYWLAGSDPAFRTEDSDPLALYRTCRPDR